MGSMAAWMALVAGVTAGAQTQNGPPRPPAPPTGSTDAPAGVTPPPGYVVGIDDELIVDFWESKDISGTVVVLPDGAITIRTLGGIQAAGLTLDQVRAAIIQAAIAKKLFTIEPTVTVVVKTINSRNVTISGEVAKSGSYPLRHNMRVTDLIAIAGGLSPYAKKDDIRLIRMENGKLVSHKVNYEEVSKGKKLEQNKVLLPGDTVIVR
jgi:polysaccharide export outer membrane protein